MPIFCRDDERLDHFGGLIVPAKLIQLPKPEVIPAYVAIWRIVRVSPQVTKVLHQDKLPIEFARVERLVLCHSPHHTATRARRRVEFIQGCLPLSGRGCDAGMLIERINELLRTHRVRIQSSKLRARDEILRERLLVLL